MGKPTDLREMPAESVELTLGVWIRMVPAPGHTEGSAVFLGHSPLDIRVNNQSFYANDGVCAVGAQRRRPVQGQRWTHRHARW